MKYLKLLSLILAMLMIVACMFACTPSDDPTDDPTDDPADDPADDPTDDPAVDYDITSFKIAGNDISEYVVVANRAIKEYSTAANDLRSAIKEKCGADLNFVGTAEPTQKVINIRAVSAVCESGFKVYEKDGNLFIDIAYKLLTPTAIAEFIDTVIKPATGEFEFAAGYTYEAPVKTIKYSDYGAKGDGVTDDYKAIKDTHDVANLYGYRVEGDANATYYIGAKGLPTVTVKTSTDWKGAKFIIDDTSITMPNVGSAKIPLFTIQPSLPALSISIEDVPSLAAGASKLGFAPGVDCLVYVEYNGVKHYIRYGNNANSGANQQEILLVKADGTIDKNTRPIWDYPQITRIWAVPVDEIPVVVQNASFKTLANEINPTQYESVNRGIIINRSNTTIQNIEHTVVQTKEYRAAYGGFFSVNNCNNILIYDCKIFCHESSYFKHPENGQSVLLGSYELSASCANNVTYDKVVQTNFFDVENQVVHNQGLMGTNYCKNMYVTNSMFARFDAHCQVYNLTVKKSDLQRVNTIGFGTVKIENTNIWGSYLADLRSDYGGLFNGDFHLKNVTMKYSGTARIALFSGSWANHDFGYTVVQPQNIYVDNLKVERDKLIYLYDTGLDSKPDLTAEYVNGAINKNPIVPTKLIQVKSNPAGTVFRVNAGPTFKNTVIEYPTDDDSGNTEISTAIFGKYLVNSGFEDQLAVNADGFVTASSSEVGGEGKGSNQIYNSANGHNYLNIRLTKNGTNQALLFSGRGNPSGADRATNVCVDVKPAPGRSNADYFTYKDYAGKSFVVAFDIKPLAKSSNVNDDKLAQLFTFSNFYQETGNFVQSGVVQMRLSDYSVFISADGDRAAMEVGTLAIGEFSTVAMHVKVAENKFDLYINETKVASDVRFLNSAEIGAICTYDENQALVPSTKANKMEDFLFSYARLARINGWEIEGDIYEFDNAKLYFSDTYLGTGDLKQSTTP